MVWRIFFILFLLSQVYSKPNLFLGTGGFAFGCGSNSPAVQVPFSSVRLGPDTSPTLKKSYIKASHFGGYSDSDYYLRAFSHMHVVGAGEMDLGILGILPKKSKGKVEIPKDDKIVFFKDTEFAQPGYYSVDVKDNITVELTSTQRTGAHTYHFKNKGKNILNIMTSYFLDRKAKKNSTTIRCGEKCLSGSSFVLGSFSGRFGGITVHYYMKWISTGQEKVYLYNQTKIDEKTTESSGNWTGAVIETNSQKFEIYVGLSYVSIDNAKQNLEKQVGQKEFKTIKAQNQNIWRKELERFQIAAISEQHQTKIDTAIYRTFLSPTLFNDFNGDYMSFKNDGSVEKVPADMKGVYTDMSLWDVHRSQMPWLLFQDLERFNDIAKSIVLINRFGGYMPKWPFAQGWTGCMIASHANTVLSDWIVKQGKKDDQLDKIQIFNYMLRNANTQTPHDTRPNTTQYLQNGYISADKSQHSVCSQTLELSFNDFSISKVAEILNKTAISDDFKNRSQFYRNVWNPNHKFFEPRFKNKTFVKISEKERLNIFSNYYVQGNAWHYRFAVPHDTNGLIELFGGEKEFVKELKKFFSRSLYWPTFWLPNPYYWHGNEHDLFSLWHFSFANRPDLTCKYSRKIIQTQYGTKGDGLPGNDDYATMSAWLIFASLGFYPLPSTQTYILGSPMIHSATIFRRKANGSLIPFNIRVLNNRKKADMFQYVQINGKKLDRFVTHSQMEMSNSQLVFIME